MVNNLLTKILHTAINYKKLLIQAAELMYTQDKIISTQKVAKLLIYMGKLFQLVGP